MQEKKLLNRNDRPSIDILAVGTDAHLCYYQWRESFTKEVSPIDYVQKTHEQHEQKTSSRTLPSGLHDHLGIILALFALYVIWGSTYLGMRIALESFPPYIMAGIRFVVAGTVLYIVLRTRGAAAPTHKQWLGAGVAGVLMILGSNGSVSFAEQYVASGLAAVGLAAVPLWSALFFGFLGRWPTRMEWLGLVVGFSGVILLNLQHGMWANPIGAIALLLAPISWALGSALSTRIALPSGLMASAAQMLIGGCAELVVALLLGERIHGVPSTRTIVAMVYLVLFGSLIAYSAYTYLLRKVRPALATSYAYVNPAVAVVLGAAFAGEPITLVGVLAMVVILTGVGLLSLKKR